MATVGTGENLPTLIVSAQVTQLSAETIFRKVWSFTAETLLYPSAETFSFLEFYC